MTVVRIVVARFGSMSFVPALARTAVIPAHNADRDTRWTQLMSRLR